MPTDFNLLKFEDGDHMMDLETAIQRATDMANCSGDDGSIDIYKYMNRYKAIRNLPNDKYEAVYDEISFRLFGR